MGKKNRPPISDSGYGGRPGDYVDPALSFRRWAENRPRESDGNQLFNAIGFILAMAMICGVIVWGIVYETGKHQQKPVPQPYERTVNKNTPAPAALRKISGSVMAVQDESSGGHAHAANKGYNFWGFIPRRYVTLNNYPTPFMIPRYVTVFLPEAKWRAAKSVEIQFFEETHLRSVAQLDYTENKKSPVRMQAKIVQGQTPYYIASGIRVDGTTYLLPQVAMALDSPIAWVIILLLGIWIGRSLLVACGIW